jgi:MoaA/NifB/PqqE/SkfB family radical SAM enzyme
MLSHIRHLAKLSVSKPQYTANLLLKKLRLQRRYSWVRSNPERDGMVPPPVYYKFMLTQDCNLKCKMCMLWGENGIYRQRPARRRNYLNWRLLCKVINQIDETGPGFIFSGGEPLLYPHFADLLSLVKEKKCFSTVCTNGLLLDKFAENISNNPYASFLVSLDGPKQQHDLLRGEGIHDRVVANIRMLKSMKKPPHVGVEFTVMPENVQSMLEFCREAAELDVDWAVFNPCWFLTQKQAIEYKNFVMRNFGVSPSSQRGYPRSYHMDTAEYVRQMEAIMSKKWPMQVSAYFYSRQQISDYVCSGQVTSSSRFCYKQWVRMDITHEGKVTPCALYPDLSFGALDKLSVLEAWNSPEYARFRAMARNNLHPLCSKCDAIYLYNPNKKFI